MIDLLQLAVEIPTEWLLLSITGLAGAAGGAIKLVWRHWTKREATKAERYKQVMDSKDDLAAKKDERIEDLSKENSRKSDEHAEKIEQLMGITLAKVEGWSEKQVELVDRVLNVQSELTAEIRAFIEEVRRNRSTSDTGQVD